MYAIRSYYVILVIGLTLMRVAINWAAGGVPTSPQFGNPANLALAFVTLLVILALLRYSKGLVRSAAVLLGTVAGTVIALLAGKANFSEVAHSRITSYNVCYTKLLRTCTPHRTRE